MEMEPNFEKIIRLMSLTNINLTQEACVAVLSVLWNKDIVCKCVKLILLQDTREQDTWLNIENHIFGCIEKLLLPQDIKLNLRNLVQPMRKQITDWFSVVKHLFYSFPDYRLKLNFVWNGKGTLDHVETAKLIISQNPTNRNFCFSLACIFCIEESAIEFEPFVYLPFLKSRFKRSGSEVESYLVSIWARYINLKKGLDEPEVVFNGCIVDNDELGCLLAQSITCVTAMKYFLERMCPVKKRAMLLKVLHVIFEHKKPQSASALMLLLPYLDKRKINHFFCHFAYDILYCFLEWPHQEFFMLVANSTWDYLSEFQYIDLFIEISNRISQFHSSYMYRNLMKEFWASSPPKLQKQVAHKHIAGILNSLFFLQNTDDIIHMILKESSADEKHEIAFRLESMSLCDHLVKTQRWESLHMFILTCITSQDRLSFFMKKFQKHKAHYHGSEIELFNIFIDKLKSWYKEIC